MAVSGYADVQLLHDLCPELTETALQRLADDASALRAFARTLLTHEVQAPAGKHLRLMNTVIVEHLSSCGGTKHERAVRAGFLGVFRRSCMLAFAVAVMQEVEGAGEERRLARQQERKAFFGKLVQGVGMWALAAGAFRLVSELELL